MTMPTGNDDRIHWQGRKIRMDFRPPTELPQSVSWETPVAPVPSDEHRARRARSNPYVGQMFNLAHKIVPFEGAEPLRGQWKTRFPTPTPFLLELGCGAGHFLAEMGTHYPDQNFLGMELRYKRVVQAGERCRNLTNVQFVRHHVGHLDRVFEPGEIGEVWVQFPDPWPKKSQLERRMINPRSALTLAWLLSPGSRVRLKSDFPPYLDWFRACFEPSLWQETAYVPDLTQWDLPWPNFPTGFERHFQSQGKISFFLEMTRLEGQVERPTPSNPPPMEEDDDR